MDIDFKAIATALKAIDYRGYFTLEADRFLEGYTEENVFDGIKQLAASARRFAEM
jgi:sugar phosphate isomerase/epimerase